MVQDEAAATVTHQDESHIHAPSQDQDLAQIHDILDLHQEPRQKIHCQKSACKSRTVVGNQKHFVFKVKID